MSDEGKAKIPDWVGGKLPSGEFQMTCAHCGETFIYPTVGFMMYAIHDHRCPKKPTEPHIAE